MDNGSQYFYESIIYLHPGDLSINDYSYHLPVERIATHPLVQRDYYKLLVWKHGHILEDNYYNLANHLPKGSLLILNDSKVIPARILFTKPTGGVIEIFCLQPYQEKELNTAMNRKRTVRWKCMIGGAGKWKAGSLSKQLLIDGHEIVLSVVLIEKIIDAYVAEFSWIPEQYSFAEVIQAAGEMPLPPYIKRKTEAADKERYQTIYANFEGSVAAPTAGLHFTEKIFSSIKEKEIAKEFVTLHVGAGTFKPIKTDKMAGHEMHAEWIEISPGTIENVITHAGNITAVGTTSLRTAESLYWMGVKSYHDPMIDISSLEITQWEVYEEPLIKSLIDSKTALMSLLKWIKTNQLQRLIIPTRILIAPGYNFRIINALVTNFHQPQSTLLLLVAAIAGNQWRSIYDYALNHEFRFLSYGDGCLLFV